MTDEELIRFFAYGGDHDRVPGGALGLRVMLDRLIDLEVIPEPDGDDAVIDIVQNARLACWERLAREEIRGLPETRP